MTCAEKIGECNAKMQELKANYLAVTKEITELSAKKQSLSYSLVDIEGALLSVMIDTE